MKNLQYFRVDFDNKHVKIIQIKVPYLETPPGCLLFYLLC